MKSPTPRRWCVHPAILTAPHETLEAAAVLNEIGAPFGVYLWQRVRDLTLWATAPADTRSHLFMPAAATSARQRLEGLPADFPACAVVLFERLLEEPHAAEAADVARAAEAVAEWASARHAAGTALAFRQAAALALPDDPERALAVGMAAASCGESARAESWLRRTVGLGRRARDWTAYTRAYLEMGHLRRQEGDPAGARVLYGRAHRQARRHAVPRSRGEALQGIMRIALGAGRLDEAERLGLAAQRWLGREDPALRHDLAELAVLRGEGGSVVGELRTLLRDRTELRQRLDTLRLLCRAAADARDEAVLEEAWPAVEELARAAETSTDAAAALLDLARGAALTGVPQRAEVLARIVRQTAKRPEEVQEAEALLPGLSSAGGAGRPRGAAARLSGKGSQRAWAVLECLGRAAVEGQGWRWGGVDGWLLYEDVTAVVPGSIAEVLPRVVRLGLADRVDVRPPGREQRVWMYRITREGLRETARMKGKTPAVIALPKMAAAEPHTFFLSSQLWTALSILQRRPGVDGGGWMNLRELAEAGARLDSLDMEWILRAELVDRQRVSTGALQTWYFRATETGRRVEVVTRYSTSRVQVRLRGEIDPTDQFQGHLGSVPPSS